MSTGKKVMIIDHKVKFYVYWVKIDDHEVKCYVYWVKSDHDVKYYVYWVKSDVMRLNVMSTG